MVKTQNFHYRGHGFDLWPGNLMLLNCGVGEDS